MASARFEEQSLDGATAAVVVTGELDMTNTGDLRRHVNALLLDGFTRVVIDLTDLTHMDSSGLAELLDALQRTRELDGGLALVVTSPTIRRTLHIRGIDGLFTIAPTRDEARASFA